MKFKIKERDGPGRIGEIVLSEEKISSPNIFFIETKRLNPPDFSEIILTNNKNNNKAFLEIKREYFFPKDLPKEIFFSIENKGKDYSIVPGDEQYIDDYKKEELQSLVIISNAKQLYAQEKRFVDFIIKLKEKIGNERCIYFPRIANPKNIALLSYLGIDLFDSLSSIISARENTLQFSYSDYKIRDLIELPCKCEFCNKKDAKKMSFNDILNHNYLELYKEIKNVRNAIKNNNLRRLVELRIKAEPNQTAILRYLDNNYFEFLEKNTSMKNKNILIANNQESLFRPEIKRFQNRIAKYYNKPKSAKILLLLPCSSKKPYSFSKSHKFFRDRLLSSGNPFVVHELIITSPIGLVPRELELIYPASNYDIPVTGRWYEEEKKMIRELLKNYLKNNKYEKIIVHIPKEIQEFVNDLLKNTEITCQDKARSEKSLNNLSNSLKENTMNFKHVKSNIRLKEDLENLSTFQFGKKITETLFKDCRIKGKYPYLKIFEGDTQLGMITKERGFISLTIDGAEKIGRADNYWIDIFDDFKLEGSVFAPGVKNADEKIRSGDEVIVFQKNKISAVGVAQMNGCEMKELTYGEAVKVRHFV